jgi:hypothetical protein
VFLALACLCFAGCVHVGQQQENPWRLFTLSPLPEPEAEQAGATASPGPVQAAIGVGPVHLPGYLDQDQIVTRISQHRVSLSENDRWAEPLEDNIGHVLAQNLSRLLQTDGITAHPWPGQQRPTYQLEIDILSFDTDTAGKAHLAARWLLRHVASSHTIAKKEVRLTASAAGTSTEQSVASLSQALGDFSVGIAHAIREFVPPRTTQSAVGAGDARALAQFPDASSAEVRYRPYRLDVHAPVSAVTLLPLLEEQLDRRASPPDPRSPCGSMKASRMSPQASRSRAPSPTTVWQE